MTRSLTMRLMSHDLLLTSTLLITLLHLLLLPAFCLQNFPLSAPQGMLMEDKIRLGSTPPSCHNQCNECNPCTAVQVPTMPRLPGRTARPLNDQPSYNHYSNYKPLGWKCRCGDRLFNP